MPAGGWCPKGRKAEDGSLASRYPLTETPSEQYWQRAEWNVRDSDGTLVLTHGAPAEGTAFTIEIARKSGKPCLVVDLSEEASEAVVQAGADGDKGRVVKRGGPREAQR